MRTTFAIAKTTATGAARGRAMPCVSAPLPALALRLIGP
jgi:hypothetical protein